MRSTPRRFTDTGSEVTVDLHGCSVRDALFIARRTVQEACWRGRSRVILVTGASARSDGPTIRSEVARAVERGAWDEWISGSTEDGFGGRRTVWIRLTGANNTQRIRMKDVLPRGRR